MFDISWTEFVLIGIVALVFIGPKELPAVMRTVGQWTRKVRSMAADFQHQFQEALREAEMADLKKQVDDMAHDIKHYDPLKDVRADVEAIGKDLEKPASEPAPAAPLPIADAAAAPAAAPSVPELPLPAEAAEPASTDAAAVARPVAPASAEDAAQAHSTERTG